MTFILFWRAMPPRKVHNRSRKAGVMSLRCSFVLKTNEYDCSRKTCGHSAVPAGLDQLQFVPGSELPGYFRFSLREINGNQDARMSKLQRGIYPAGTTALQIRVGEFPLAIQRSCGLKSALRSRDRGSLPFPICSSRNPGCASPSNPHSTRDCANDSMPGPVRRRGS